MTAGRIDTHHHVVPPLWADALRATGYFGGQPIPSWSPQAALDLMDELGIATAITSVSRPGVFLGDGTDPVPLATAVNEFAAELARDHPGRFGFFASLPLPDVKAALAEIDHALDDLGADGIVLLSNIDGRYLGDPEYDPVLAELARRESVLFVHPTSPGAPALEGVPPFAADFLLDTTRAATDLVRHRVPERYPGLKIVLSHAGGFVPYAGERIAGITRFVDTGEVDREAFLAGLRSFWFDTALSSSRHTLPSLLSFADPGRVLYGTDWPYAPGDNSQHFTHELEAYGIDDDLRAGIDRGNAERLLPRWAQPS